MDKQAEALVEVITEWLAKQAEMTRIPKGPKFKKPKPGEKQQSKRRASGSMPSSRKKTPPPTPPRNQVFVPTEQVQSSVRPVTEPQTHLQPAQQGEAAPSLESPIPVVDPFAAEKAQRARQRMIKQLLIAGGVVGGAGLAGAGISALRSPNKEEKAAALRTKLQKAGVLALPSPKGMASVGEKLRGLWAGGKARAADVLQRPGVQKWAPVAGAGLAAGGAAHLMTRGGGDAREKELAEQGRLLPKSASFARFAKRAAEMSNDAAALGLLVGFERSIVPSQETFEKVASKTGYSAKSLRRVYLEKASAAWPWVLGGLGAAAVGAPLVSNLAHRAMYPSYYEGAPGWGLMDAPNLGTYGGLSPAAEQEAWKTIAREGLKHRQMSSVLQGIAGAQRPAPSPWGSSHPGAMPY